jgi:amidase
MKPLAFHGHAGHEWHWRTLTATLQTEATMNLNRRTMMGALAGAAATGITRTSLAGGPTVSKEPGVSDLQAAMGRGALTSVQLVRRYLARIEQIDRRGPHLRSVLEVNPDAIKIAAALDAERRAKGPRGPLHGIPVLVKDNIATGDRMSTTAGSLALASAKAPRDASVVARLRDAGAVMLGKTNLSEWANIRSSHSTSGWSGRGGLTLNPYALDRNPSGSSSGSAVATTAGLAPLAVGTETDGSIVSPASICGLVGIKPTVGLVSRHGIIPISRTQDTAGPMACSVADAVALLAAMAGTDPLDPATQANPGSAPDYLRALDRAALAGARLGLVRGSYTGLDPVDALIDQAVSKLKELGATVVDPVELPDTKKYADAELDVLLYELKAGLSEYLPAFAPGAAVQTLADVIAFNERVQARELHLFSQDLFVKAQAKGGLDDPAYKDARALCRRLAREEGIDKVLADNKLDALIAPTGAPAWLTDLVDGDNSGASFSTPAAVAGYPHITVPAGFVAGLPVGLSFVGGAFTEAKLISYAFAYEQATHHRRAPGFARSASLKM